MIFQSLPGSLNQDEKPGLLNFIASVLSHWFVPLLCKTSTHNTQCIIPLAIKGLSKETGHYLSHVLRFGAHVFLQHKKLIPKPGVHTSFKQIQLYVGCLWPLSLSWGWAWRSSGEHLYSDSFIAAFCHLQNQRILNQFVVGGGGDG